MRRRVLPAPAATLGPAQWIRAAYASGSRIVSVNAFVLRSGIPAFELQQKWNLGTGGATFHGKSVFVVCRPETGPVSGALPLARQLEQVWP